MQTNVKSRCLDFLYGQVSKGNIPHIRKGMAEEFEAFIESIRAEDQSKRIIDRMELEAQAKALGADQIKKRVEDLREQNEASNE